MLIPETKYLHTGERKRTIIQTLSLGPVMSKVIGITLLSLLALFYLAQSTQSATRNYTIQNLEDQKKELQAAKDDLTVEAMRLKSLQTIQNSAEEMKLESE